VKKLQKIVDSVSWGAALISTGALAVMLVVVVANVIGRRFLHQPIAGTTELTEMAMLCIVFLALAWCAVERAHISVGVVMERFSPRVQAIVDSINYLAGLGLCILIVWQTILRAIDVQEQGLTTFIHKVPHFPFYWVIAAGFAILCLVMVGHLIQHLVRAVKE
jgi:TRAP-type C4-dicarboxylate transport system permease small subunit